MALPLEYLEIGRKAPCGCLLRFRTVFDPAELASDDDFSQSLPMSSFWFQNRMARHECALVSEKNPCGVRPEPKKEPV